MRRAANPLGPKRSGRVRRRDYLKRSGREERVEHARGHNRAAALSRDAAPVQVISPVAGMVLQNTWSGHELSARTIKYGNLSGKSDLPAFRRGQGNSRVRGSDPRSHRQTPLSKKIMSTTCELAFSYNPDRLADITGLTNFRPAWRLATPASYGRWGRWIDNPSFGAARRQLRVASFFG